MPDESKLREVWAARPVPGAGHPDEVAWERLLCDELSADERTRVLEHVTACAECTPIYKALLQVEEGARAIDPELPGRRVHTPATPWLWGGLAAAAVLLLVVLLPKTPAPSPAGPSPTAPSPVATSRPPVSLADLGSFAPPRWSPVTLRGETDRELEAAMARYAAGDCVGAEGGLADAVAADPAAAAPRFFLGICHLLLGRLPAGIASLEAVTALGDTPYLEEALYYEAKGHLLAGDAGAARATLARVVELDGERRDEARDLLDRIDVAIGEATAP